MAKVLLGDVVDHIKDKVDKDTTDLEYYVGGEHIDGDEIMVRRKGLIQGSTIGPAFHMRFRQGDVLLMSRNPHLRKASMVDFEGICSDVSYVCRTKDNGVLLQSLLPFILQTPEFWQFAEENKKGGLPFFLNWKDFARFEFDLIPIDRQQLISDLLWAMERVKNAYRELIARTDDLVKSQFIERFEGHGYETVKAKSFMSNMRNGVSPSKKGSHAEKVLTLSAVTQGSFDPDAWKDGIFDECPPSDKRIHTSEFYMCRGNGNKTLVGTAVYSMEDRDDLVFPDTVIAAHIDSGVVLMPYLFVAWKMPKVREQIESSARTTNGTYKINQTVLSNVELVVPPIDKQSEFVSFVEQSDKSKYLLRHTAEAFTIKNHRRL